MIGLPLLLIVIWAKLPTRDRLTDEILAISVYHLRIKPKIVLPGLRLCS